MTVIGYTMNFCLKHGMSNHVIAIGKKKRLDGTPQAYKHCELCLKEQGNGC